MRNECRELPEITAAPEEWAVKTTRGMAVLSVRKIILKKFKKKESLFLNLYPFSTSHTGVPATWLLYLAQLDL